MKKISTWVWENVICLYADASAKELFSLFIAVLSLVVAIAKRR